MIVRDNESTIRPALESIRPWVDEMIVVDTGSTDATPEICRELGADVHHFAWCDDFSAARNESLRHARGEWIFWMDSDDVIDEASGRELAALVRRQHPEDLLGFLVPVRCPVPTSQNRTGSEQAVTYHVKLFRNHRDVRFAGRVHETPVRSIEQQQGRLDVAGLEIRHAMADLSPEGVRRRLQRNARLAALEIAADPEAARGHFMLALTHFDAGQFDAAVAGLWKCLRLTSTGDTTRRLMYVRLVAALSALRLSHTASECCREALTEFPDDPNLLFEAALQHLEAERADRAAALFSRILALGPRSAIGTIHDPGVFSFKARHGLAQAHDLAGRLDDAAREWRQVVQVAPRFRAAWQGLSEVLLKQGDMVAVAGIVAALQNQPEFDGLVTWLKARALVAGNQESEACTLLMRLHRHHPRDQQVLALLARLCFRLGRPEESLGVLDRQLALDPTKAEVHHNRGLVLESLGRTTEATAAFAAAIASEPGSEAARASMARLGNHDAVMPDPVESDGEPSPLPDARCRCAAAKHSDADAVTATTEPPADRPQRSSKRVPDPA